MPVVLLTLFLAAAALVAAGQGSKQPIATTEPPTLLLVNGILYTGDPAHPRAEAVAIRGEKIIAVGTSRELRAKAGPQTRVVDLQGRFAMPGFNDAHIHLGSGGQAKLAVDLEGSKSLAELQERIRVRLADYKPGDWITGRGWDHTLWPEKRFPTRRDLDAVSTNHPMVFTRVDGHVSVANSLALRLAGITRETKDPAGGSIEHDAVGEPTGLLKETAMHLVSGKVPPLSAAQRRRAIELALAEAARHGVTSLQDNSAWEDFLVYQQLKKEGKLTVRITEWLPFLESLPRLQQMRKAGGTQDPWLKTGALKAVLDGSLGSRTAAMLAPYADDSSNRGILRIEQKELIEMARARDAAGFQLAFHAIGDAANCAALNAFATVAVMNPPRDRRPRIEHAQVVAEEDLPRLAELGVIASMQPSHETTDMRWAEARVGPERAKGAYAWKSMLEKRVRLAFGTDYPVEPVNPMRGLYACVTRELPEGGPAGGWQPQEKISLDDCIHAYTVGSAYAQFEEGKKGRLAPGQWADIIVLSADITKIPPAQLLKTEVLQTYVGGRLVYEKK
ncbi:MAG: amidohydrolase [Acidobacteria bacterium]|nr:amidohydrolase [Acidobacteriota bacterium]